MTTSLPIVTPVQGFLGGLGLALSSSLLLFGTGHVFGVSGFVHGSFDLRGTRLHGWTSAKTVDVVAFTGLVLGGALIGSLETQNFEILPPLVPITGRDLLKVGIAGFLTGIGSRLQRGCTSGHMLCGVARFSWRSIAATLIFFPVAALTSQVNRHRLPTIHGYDWSIGPLGAPLIAIQAILLITSGIVLALATRNNSNRSNYKATQFLKGFITVVSAVDFALALRLSAFSSPTKVLSFLITPFSDPRIFDSTLLFFAISAIPTSIAFYQLASWLRRPSAADTGEDAKNNTHIDKRRPLIQKNGNRTKSNKRRIQVPILNVYDQWPGLTSAGVNLRLVIGAILFGVGWSLEGICPGPALVNFGSSMFAFSQGANSDLYKWSIWLASCVLGGFSRPVDPLY